ncbi:MAG: hypothetical protein HKN37_06140 [Rhodothermales bacterium]|nr:hypothetical protein [Rhodothermales bacterium]
MNTRTIFHLLSSSAIVLLLASCAGLRPAELPPDEQFGHRFEGKAADGRETIVIRAPETEIEYVHFPAVHDTVHVRPAVAESPDGAGTRVEVLIKGAFPDSCTELDSVEQERAAHILNVRLQMRRQRGVLCATVVRPYRFYLLLEGLYEPGHYSLKINDSSHPFVIRAVDR